jgi:hypothetical protein
VYHADAERQTPYLLEGLERFADRILLEMTVLDDEVAAMTQQEIAEARSVARRASRRRGAGSRNPQERS